MMSRLRFVLVWLVMAAIPLQGLAAATMTFCAGAHEGRSSVAAAAAGSADAKGHDHSQHVHAAKVDAMDDGGSLQKTGAKALQDTAHKCGVCSSCCHSIAIAELPQWPAFAPLPQADLAEIFVVIDAPPSVVPDKPPRA